MGITMKWIECVPNISEGKNQIILDTLSAEIKKFSGVKLLDVDSGKSTNRTVFTFVGDPKTLEKAIYQFVIKALKLIDMQTHTGLHPRLGAVDVLPFVPLFESTITECIELAHRVGKRIGDELQIPVYMYAKAATNDQRIRLHDIRKGEYEGLEQKLQDPLWKPDYGLAKFVPQSGALVIGARELMIAYNIHLDTKDVSLAKKIASLIRESGTGKKLKGCQAMGWFIPEYHCAQISTNLHDINATPLHLVYETCCELAKTLRTNVTGSEIIGMVPKKSLIDSGKYFAPSKSLSENELISVAIDKLGLNRFHQFELQEKIIEKKLGSQ
ncbi:MAG: glutamate formimidoyltransferase [Deltaproteobacteria bacterium RIFCSPLOWO2_02_FULL_44_10]|nr:MAG: glutamate formimidoyltransferase [Deltaproteobacteria bacterium RIFCSPHIGHO2_02_FULL_44_16]OGQ46446.1 MAG: glutamate formimidoyltransferase [Deltaproteobacteria bacterium RIFCSPLOWO2_02_FULL_44_10]